MVDIQEAMQADLTAIKAKEILAEETMKSQVKNLITERFGDFTPNEAVVYDGLTRDLSDAYNVGGTVIRVSQAEDEKAWLLARKSGIGASDIGAVLGKNPYKTAYDVWLDKTSTVIEQIDNESMYWGRKLEPLCAERYAKETGKSLQKDNCIRVHPQYPFITASLDYFTYEEDSVIVECKTASSHSARHWETEVPISYYWQAQQQMAVTGLRRADIALLVDMRFKVIPIERNEEHIEFLIREATKFWHYVQTGTEPPLTFRDAEKVRSEEFTAHLDHAGIQLFEEYLRLTADIKEREAQAEKLKETLCEFMGKADSLADPTGRVVATWKSQDRKTFDSKAFQVQHTELYNQFSKTSSSRVFRLKGTKNND